MDDDDLTPVWKALADPARRRLLDLVSDGPRTTGDLCAGFAVSRFATMKHLSVLERAGLILVRRRGRERWNHLNAVPLRRIHERWLNPYAARLASSLLRLKHGAEEQGATTAMPTTSPAIRTFVIAQEVAIDATPAHLYDALIDVQGWWHMPMGDVPSTMRLEAWPGGRFFQEYTTGGGGMLYATVAHAQPGKRLRMTGAIGITNPVLSVIDFQLEARGAGTQLKLSHSVLGEEGDDTFQSYSQGWNELLTRGLKPFAEGRPLGGA